MAPFAAELSNYSNRKTINERAELGGRNQQQKPGFVQPPASTSSHTGLPRSDSDNKIEMGKETSNRGNYFGSNRREVDKAPGKMGTVLSPEFVTIGKPRRFYNLGRVFKVLWTEPASASSSASSHSSLTPTSQGQLGFTEFRRFVVVRNRSNCSICLSINTYGGQGTTKPSIRSQDHAIVFAQDETPPDPLVGESMEKEPFPLIIERNGERLSPISRLDFGRVYTVEHNVKVMNLGRIHPEHLDRLDRLFIESSIGGNGVSTVKETIKRLFELSQTWNLSDIHFEAQVDSPSCSNQYFIPADRLKSICTVFQPAPPISIEALNQALREELSAAQIEWPSRSDQYFIPANHLNKILNRNSIRKTLFQMYSFLAGDEEKLNYYTDSIHSRSKKVLALLILAGGPAQQMILDFVDENLKDSDLPFERSVGIVNNKSYALWSRAHNCEQPDHRNCGIRSISKLSPRAVKDLHREQWSVQAPVFRSSSDKIIHYDLADNIILPFTEEEKTEQKGGYGEIWSVRIHPAHHDFYSNETRGRAFAVMRTSTKDSFYINQKRRDIRHPHLSELLATFQYQNRLHMVFQHSSSDLRSYWRATDMPYWNKEVCIWVLEQILGLSSVLSATLSWEIQLKNLQEPEKTSLCHSKVSPENILYFDNPGMGILKIFPRTSSDRRPQISTYDSPEYSAWREVSWAYDIWSLGCIFLEFITWLLLGTAGLDTFSSKRTTRQDDGRENDCYYDIIVESGKSRRVEVRPAVAKWINGLRSTKRHSGMILAILELVEFEMLIVEADKRIPLSKLEARLKRILEISKADVGYLLGDDPNVSDETSGIRKKSKELSCGEDIAK